MFFSLTILRLFRLVFTKATHLLNRHFYVDLWNKGINKQINKWFTQQESKHQQQQQQCRCWCWIQSSPKSSTIYYKNVISICHVSKSLTLPCFLRIYEPPCIFFLNPCDQTQQTSCLCAYLLTYLIIGVECPFLLRHLYFCPTNYFKLWENQTKGGKKGQNMTFL